MTRFRLPARPQSRALALEPRILFDGAAAVATEQQFAAGPAADAATGDSSGREVAATTPVPTADPAPTLLVVDARVADTTSLLADLPANVLVRLVDARESGLAAISAALGDRRDIASIQIVSHGSAGSFTLGRDTVTAQSLEGDSAAQVQDWASHLGADADILLYGCDIASGDGATLLARLAALTGADIAASSNATGNAARGGDWVLEQQTGPIDRPSAMSATARAAYDGLLAAPAIGGATAGQTVNDNGTRTPFAGVTITDPDVGNTQTLTVTLDNAAKGSLSNLGGGSYSAGVYTFTGSASAAQAAIRGLVFTPTANRVAPGASETTVFTIAVNDGTTTVSNSTTSVVATSINDSPTAVADTNTIAEEATSVSANVLSNDTDPDPGDTRTVTALSGGSLGLVLIGNYGSLVLNADGSYIYTLDNAHPAVQALGVGSAPLADSFSYTMRDTAGATATATLTIDIHGTNDQPLLQPAAITVTQAEDSAPAISVTALLSDAASAPLWSDVDNGTMGIAITAAATTASSGMTGTWFYHLGSDAPGVWTPFPVVSAGAALLLPGDAQIRFVVASSQVDSQNSGTVALTYTAWDASSGSPGGSGNTTAPTSTAAFSSASITTSLNVTPVNDAPTFSASPLVVNERSSALLTGGFTNDSTQVAGLTGNLRLYDPDNTTAQILYRVEELPTKGTLTLNGATLAVGSLFAQSSIASITYTPTVAELSADTTDRVYFSIRDGAGGVIGSDGKTGANPWAVLDITIRDVNAQVAVGGTSVAIGEDNAHPGTAVTAPIPLSLSDADDPGDRKRLTVTSLPTATFGTLEYWDGSAYVPLTQTLVNAGFTLTQAELTDAAHPALRFSYNNQTEPTDQNGTPIVAQSQTTFTVHVADHNDHLTETVADATVTLNITPANDPPVLTTHDLTVAQGSGNNPIGGANLTTTDPDSPANLRTYTVAVDPNRGYLTLNGLRIGRGSTFSESDLTGGHLKYTCNDPYYNGNDSLQVIAADGHGGDSGVHTLNIVITPTGSTPPVGSGSDGGGNTVSIGGLLQGVVPEGLFLTLDQWMLTDAGSSANFTVAAPSHGKVYLSGVEVNYGVTAFTQADINAGRVVYLHDSSEASGYAFTDSLSITATKGGATVTRSFAITVTPVDDAPTITQTSAGPITTNQDGGTLMEQAAGGGNGMAGADFALSGVANAVKLSPANFQWHDVDNTQSELTYIASAVGGTVARWNGSAWGAILGSFSADDLAAGKIAYFHDPAADVANPGDTTIGGSVTVHLIDGGSVAAGDVVIAAPNIGESGSLTVFDGTNTLVLAKDALMRSPSRTVSFIVGDVNDAPVANNGSFTVAEFSSGLAGQSDHIQILGPSIVSASDADTANGSWTYTLTAVPTYGKIQQWNGSAWNDLAANATFTYADLNGGNLRYVNTGRIAITAGFSWNSANDSFKFKVNDGETLSTPNSLDSNEATVAVFLRPTNQPPTVVNNGPTTVPEGGARKITGALLGSADAPNNADIVAAVDPDHTRVQVQYRITANVGHGVLYLGDPTTGATSIQLSVGSAITLADLQGGRLWYQHDGTDAAPYANVDSFDYAISDASGMTEPTATFVIHIVPVNDAPAVTGLVGGATFTEGDTSASPNVTPVVIDSSVTLSDSDLANNGADFRGGSLRLTYATGGANVTSAFDQLAVRDGGSGAGQIGVSGSNITYGGTVIGSIDGTENGTNGAALKIVFDAGANPALTIPAIKALIEAVTFAHSEYDNAVTGTRTLNATLVDGGGSASYTDDKNVTLSGADTWSGSATVVVVAANDRPVLTPHTGGGNLVLGTIGEDDTATPTTFQVSSFTSAVNGSADGTHTGIADVDTGAVRGVAITALTNAATGHWEYSADGSSGWTTIAGVSASHALLLAASDYVRFVPDGKDGGTATFTYLAWDTTTGTPRSYVDPTTNGTQTAAFSAAADTAEVAVTAINDAPTLGGSGTNSAATVTVTEDVNTTLGGLTSLALADVDAGSHPIKVTLSLSGSGTFGFASATAGVSTSSGSAVAPALSGNSGSIDLYGTAADLHTALGKLQYQSALDANRNNSAGGGSTPVLTITADDQGWGINGGQTSALTTTRTLTIDIAPANDTPTLTVAPGTFNVVERTSGSAATPVANTILVADASDINDSNYGQAATTTWANPSLVITALHGTLALNASAANLSAVLSNGNRTLTLSSTQTATDVLADLNGALLINTYLDYLPDLNFSGVDTLSLTLHDQGNAGGTDKTATGSIAVLVSGINDAPSFVALDGTPTFVENASPVVLDGNATLADPELSTYNNWGGAVLTLARQGGANGDDVFGLTGSGNSGVNFSGGTVRIGTTVIGSVSNGGGQLQITLVDGVTTAQANTLLQAITYSNANNNPPAGVTIDYFIDDGNTNTGTTPQGSSAPLHLTGSGSIAVTIVRMNDTPTLTGLAARSYTEDGAAIGIGGGALAADPELSALAGASGDWGGATLTLSRHGGASAEDQFSAGGTLAPLTEGGSLIDGVTPLGTVTGNSNGTLVLTFASGVSTSQIQSAITQIAYANSRQSLGASGLASVTLDWVLDDQNPNTTGGGSAGAGQDQGGGGRLAATTAQTISLSGRNDAPVLADTDLALTQVEDAAAPGGAVGTLVSTLASGANIGDNDATDPKGLAITAADSSHGTWYYSLDGGGSWTSFTASAGNALLLAADAGTRIYFQPAADWHGTTAAALDVRAWDGSSGSNGARADLSVGGSSGGTTAFSSASDTVRLTVTPVNDAPTLAGGTSLGATDEDTPAAASAAAIAAACTYNDGRDDQSGNGGNSTATAQTALAIVGNAATAAQGTWEYTLDGSTWNAVSTAVGNATAVVLDLADAAQQIRFVPAADYNGTPGGLTLRAADGSWDGLTGVRNIAAAVGGSGAWSSGTAALGIVVHALNDAPAVNGLDATPVFVEGRDSPADRNAVGTPILVDASVTIADVEIVTQAVDNFAGTTLTVARDNGSGGFAANAADLLALSGAGTVSTSGTVVAVGGTPVADITGNSGGQLVITFRGNATASQVNAVASAVTYALDTDTPPASVTLRYRFNDDNQGAVQGSGGSLTGDATVTIAITAQNDPPLAVDDAQAIAEDAVSTGGNVLSGSGSPSSVADSDPENDPLTVTAVRPGSEGAGGPGLPVAPGTDSANGTVVSGLYGSLTLGADGSYVYLLDNGNPAVNALHNGETLSETFTYTTGDGHGGSDTAQLTITIHGRTDGPLAITPVDGNGAAAGQTTVREAGLTSAGDPGETSTGSITVAALDGLASVTLGGTTLTAIQLQALTPGTPVVIDTGTGLLTLTGFTPSSSNGGLPTAGSLDYTYTLKAAVGQPGASESVDPIALTVTDRGAATASGVLTVRIVDDQPTANADANAVTEDSGTPASGNVFGGGSAGDVADRLGADVRASPVTAIAFGATPGTVGSPLAGAYGHLTLNGDGSYSYTLDNSNIAVNALRSGQTLSETFAYTLTDSDGDASSSQLTITIHGNTDGAPSITPVDGNGSATGQATVNEAGLTSGSDPGETTSGSIVLSSFDGLGSVTLGGTTLSVAQLQALSAGAPVTIDTGIGLLTLTGFTASSSNGGLPTAGTLDYTYTLKAGVGQPGASESVDAIPLAITDHGGATASGTLTVRIVDDQPSANADANAVTEDSGTPASGNVFGGGSAGDVADRLGADVRANPVTAVAFGATAGSIGTPLAGAYGHLTLNGDGSYRYVLDDGSPAVNNLLTGQTLSETFTYTVTDSDGDTSTAQLVITIHGRNDPPVATDDHERSPDGQPVIVKLLDNDRDSDGGTLAVTHIAGIPVAPGGTVTLPSGKVTLNVDGTVTFAPNPDANGPTVFTYQISDGQGGTATATVTIDVTPASRVGPAAAPPGEIGLSPTTRDSLARLTGDQAGEPSVFFEGDQFSRILRLPIPFHPVVYVNRAVETAQEERGDSDPRGSGSDPRAVRSGDSESRSLGAGLGLDPNLFVQPAVRASQTQGAFLDNVVDGRHGVLSLSSDGLLITPTVFQIHAGHSPLVRLGDAGGERPTPLADAAPEPARLPEPAAHPGRAAAVARVGAPSFSEQLRSTGSRPLAGRAPTTPRTAS